MSHIFTPTVERAMNSHAIRLTLKLLELGILPQGKASFFETRHDDYCPTLSTGMGLECNCNCEIEFGGQTYTYDSIFVRQQDGCN